MNHFQKIVSVCLVCIVGFFAVGEYRYQKKARDEKRSAEFDLEVEKNMRILDAAGPSNYDVQKAIQQQNERKEQEEWESLARMREAEAQRVK